jgi:hypothetical protein
VIGPGDKANASRLLSSLGAIIPDGRIEPFWEALETARRKRDIRSAARAPRATPQKNLSKARGLAMKLKQALGVRGVQERLAGAFPVDQSITDLVAGLDLLIAEAARQERQLDGAGLDLGSPGDQLIQSGLAEVARDYLGIEATAPGDPPGGPFVDFVRAVFAAWDERPPTADSIKSSLYRA